MASQPRIRSLKRLCCQTIAVHFWRDPANEKFLVWNLYENNKVRLVLKEWVSKLELPKMLEKDQTEIAFTLGLDLQCLFLEYNLSKTGDFTSAISTLKIKSIVNFSKKSLSSVDNFYNLLALSPSGRINLELTLQRVLQSPQMDPSAKCCLAMHFSIGDPEISNNYEEIIGKLPMQPGFAFYWARHNLCCPKMQLIHQAMMRQNVWAVMYYWSKLDKAGRNEVAGCLFEIAEIRKGKCQDNMRFDMFLIISFLLDNLSLPEQEELLSLCITDYQSVYYLLKGIIKFTVSFLDNHLEQFLEKLESMTLKEDHYYDFIYALMDHLICDNMFFLYPVLLSFWHRWSMEHRKAFVEKFLLIVISNFGGKNANYTKRIILEFQKSLH